MKLSKSAAILIRRAGESRLFRTTAGLSWGFQCRGVEDKRMVAAGERLEKAGYLRLIATRESQDGFGRFAVFRKNWEWELTDAGRELLATLTTNATGTESVG